VVFYPDLDEEIDYIHSVIEKQEVTDIEPPKQSKHPGKSLECNVFIIKETILILGVCDLLQWYRAHMSFTQHSPPLDTVRSPPWSL